MNATLNYLPTIISFYCDVDGTTFYSDCAKNLIATCKKLGVPHYIINRFYGSTWIDNVRAKPKFILDTMSLLVVDCIWLDVDCHLLRKPDFVFDKWAVCLREDGSPHDFVHYIPYTKQSRLFLKDWIAEIDQAKRGSHTAFTNIAKDYDILPDGYFEIGLADVKSKKDYLLRSDNGKDF